MHHKKHPLQDGLNPVSYRDRFDNLPHSTAGDWLHCYLIEVAHVTIHQLCEEILTLYRIQEKRVVTVQEDADRARVLAAALFVKGSQTVNQSVQRLYELEE